jgi:hypothetical protein
MVSRAAVNCIRDATLLASLAWARRCFTRCSVALFPIPCAIRVSLALGRIPGQQPQRKTDEIGSALTTRGAWPLRLKSGHGKSASPTHQRLSRSSGISLSRPISTTDTGTFQGALFVLLSRFCPIRYCIVHCSVLVSYRHSSGDPSTEPQTIEQALKL